MTDNAVRAEKALAACRCFSRAGVKEDLATVITDLIADLMHLAKQEGIDPGGCVMRAEMHYDAEILEEEDE